MGAREEGRAWLLRFLWMVRKFDKIDIREKSQWDSVSQKKEKGIQNSLKQK